MKNTSTKPEPKFTCEINQLPSGKWGSFYYCPGSGFDAGRSVYYGRNEWNTEADALAAKASWERRLH